MATRWGENPPSCLKDWLYLQGLPLSKADLLGCFSGNPRTAQKVLHQFRLVILRDDATYTDSGILTIVMGT